jgi:hypothetical protein
LLFLHLLLWPTCEQIENAQTVQAVEMCFDRSAASGVIEIAALEERHEISRFFFVVSFYDPFGVERFEQPVVDGPTEVDVAEACAMWFSARRSSNVGLFAVNPASFVSPRKHWSRPPIFVIGFLKKLDVGRKWRKGLWPVWKLAGNPARKCLATGYYADNVDPLFRVLARHDGKMESRRSLFESLRVDRDHHISRGHELMTDALDWILEHICARPDEYDDNTVEGGFVFSRSESRVVESSSDLLAIRGTSLSTKMANTPPPLHLISHTLIKALQPDPDNVVWDDMPIYVQLLAEAEKIRLWAEEEAAEILEADTSNLSEEEIQALEKIQRRPRNEDHAARREIHLTLSLLLRKNVRNAVFYCLLLSSSLTALLEALPPLARAPPEHTSSSARYRRRVFHIADTEESRSPQLSHRPVTRGEREYRWLSQHGCRYGARSSRIAR